MSIIDDVRIHPDWTKDGYEFEDLSKPEITLAEASESIERIGQLTGVIEALVTVNKIMEEIPFESGIYQIDFKTAEEMAVDYLDVGRKIHSGMPVRFYTGDDKCRWKFMIKWPNPRKRCIYN